MLAHCHTDMCWAAASNKFINLINTENIFPDNFRPLLAEDRGVE